MILDGILTGFPHQTVEKAAILSDIARFWSLIIGLSRSPNLKKQILKYRVDLAISIFAGFIVLAMLTMMGQDIAFMAVKGWKEGALTSVSYLYVKEEVSFYYQITTNSFIIANYLAIFVFLFLSYSRLKRQHAQYLSKQEVQTMNRDLASLALLFLSICQLYGLRIYRAFVYQLGITNNGELYKVVGVMPDISKAVMILGICLSVYWRINIATDRQDCARQIT